MIDDRDRRDRGVGNYNYERRSNRHAIDSASSKRRSADRRRKNPDRYYEEEQWEPSGYSDDAYRRDSYDEGYRGHSIFEEDYYEDSRRTDWENSPGTSWEDDRESDRRSRNHSGGGSGKRKSSRKNSGSRKKTKKSGHGLRIALITMCVVILLGFAGIGTGLLLFRKSTGQSLFSCIKEGHEIAANSKDEDFHGGSISYLYASDGKKIGELSLSNDSVYLKYDQIPKAFIDAFVAVEDRSFWSNNGTDPKGIARVLWTFVRSGGKTANGASTITQQLVKLTYLSSEKSLNRKVKEIIIAQDITKMYTKEEIAAYYCNACCFANGIFGISDAAEAYFGTTPDQLSLSQIAYLCAIPNRPEYYNPKKNPENALSRRDKILKDMLEEGYITEAEYSQAINEKISIYQVVDEDSDYNYETTYTIYCAAKCLMKLSGFEFRTSFLSMDDYQNYQEEYDDAYTEAKNALYSGGYKVYTTLDTGLQDRLQQVVDEDLADKDSRLENGIYQVQGAMTVIDNKTGKVVGVVGGRSQEETRGIYTLNRVFQGYAQPGSSIKPLVVYTPALDSGEYGPGSYLVNVDVTEAKEEHLNVSEIQEMDGEYISLRSAVENSLNGCAYWLFSKIGVKNGISYIQNMGFSRVVPNDYNMSTCLGGMSYGVTTEEMANAYETIANGGTYQDADCIVSILDKDGNEIYQEAEEIDVYTVQSCELITDVMKGVLTDGTAKNSDWYDYTETDAAGKTGTTNDNKAAWFCGYTPYYTIAVWVGCDTPTAINGLTGGSYPLRIWQDAMLLMIDGLPEAHFKEIEEEEEEEQVYCICSSKCTEDSRNEDCPICRYDIWDCEGHEAVCICEERCFSDSLNEKCPVCMRDVDACEGKELKCICDEKCSEEDINEDCAFCKKDYHSCCAPDEMTEETSEEETTPEEPETETEETETQESVEETDEEDDDSGEDDEDDEDDEEGEDHEDREDDSAA